MARSFLFSLFAIALTLFGCANSPTPRRGVTTVEKAKPQTVAPTPAATRAVPDLLGGQPLVITSAKKSGCMKRGDHGNLPDPDCTPGDTLDVAAETICVTGYTAKVRNVSKATKKKVWAMYGARPGRRGTYEVDHLIPLELGGSNDITNLWPELQDPRPGFREKDVIENRLHREVCAGRMTLTDAQDAIAKDWRTLAAK